MVDSYISNPDPVGSRLVTKKYAFNLSPATIRNIMADLEEMGFLHQPHTSAGRIPTDKGYRFYVDSLAVQEEDNALLAAEITRRLERIRKDITGLLNETTRTLSEISHYLGIALLPKPDQATLQWIKLFRYRKDYIAFTLLTDEGIMNSKILPLDPAVTQRDLDRIADYLNTEFSGSTITEIKARVLREMERDKMICDSLIARAIEICREAIYFGTGDVFISGFSEVLGLPDFADLGRIREISRAIEDRHLMVKLLDSLSEPDRVKVVIGSEHDAEEMKRFSMVVSTYKEGGRPMGTIGLIGPTRMDYLRAITVVDTTARFLTKVLSER